MLSGGFLIVKMTLERANVYLSTFDRPWDFSIQDTSEEVRLILHMWIGLFYSRSTPRFFHFDSNSLNPSLDESDDLKMPSRVVPAMAPCLNVGDTSDTLHLNALDLSKKDGSDCAVLDLSQRTARAEIVLDPHVNQRQTPGCVVQKEASGTRIMLESLEVPQKASTFQVRLLHIITLVLIFKLFLE